MGRHGGGSRAVAAIIARHRSGFYDYHPSSRIWRCTGCSKKYKGRTDDRICPSCGAQLEEAPS